MKRAIVSVVVVAGALLGSEAQGANAQDLVIQGGEVWPVSGPAIPNGVVVVRAGRIAAVGPRDAVVVPEGMDVLDATGMIVTPGFIDAGTSIARGGRGGGPRQLIRPPDFRVSEGLGELRVPGAFGMEAGETVVHPWVMDGVTTAYIAPAATSLVAGFGAVVKLDGATLGEVLSPAAALHVTLGDQLRFIFDRPTTRQGMVAALRQWLGAVSRAIDDGAATVRLGSPFSEIEEAAEVTHPITPELRAVLAGEVSVRFRAQTPEDILAAIRVGEEYGLQVVVEGASGAHMVAEALGRTSASVVVGPAMVGSSANAPETFARTPENAAVLSHAGVPVALSTESAGGRSVAMEVVVARGHGLSQEAALRAVTIGAARILGVEDRVGSLEDGKDADLVLWSNDPVSTWAEAQIVVVGGSVVYRR
jgi:imidazolonepropionase-like amidohydrolase